MLDHIVEVVRETSTWALILAIVYEVFWAGFMGALAVSIWDMKDARRAEYNRTEEEE